MTKTNFTTGDIVMCTNSGAAYAGLLTKGKLYMIMKVDSTPYGPDSVTVASDKGGHVSCYASRFTVHTSAKNLWAVTPTPAPSLVDKQREERKAAEAARKAKGVARAEAMKAPQFKKPLLFTEVSEADVYGAIAKMLQAQVYLGTLQVVGIDKTTEGFKLTLGVPA
jgi:hypothetical protein